MAIVAKHQDESLAPPADPEQTSRARSTAPQRSRSVGGERLKAALAPAALLLVFLVAWQLIPPAMGVQAFILPTPTRIAEQMGQDWSVLWPNLLVTLREILLGFALAFVVAMVLGFGVAHSRVVNRAVYPLLVASQTVPVIAIAPVFIIWFGYGLTPKVVITALICFFPLTVNTVAGYAGVDADARMLFRAHGASRFQTFRLLSLPSALPSIFAGVKISVTLSVIGATIGEWVGSEEGLGYIILQASSQMVTARVFAAIVLLSFTGVLLFLAATVIERLVLPWRSSPTE